MILNPLQLGVMGAAAAAGLFAGSPAGRPVVRQAAAKAAKVVKTAAAKVAPKAAPAAATATPAASAHPPLPTQLEAYRSVIERGSERYWIPVPLLAALMIQENRLADPRATRNEPVPSWVSDPSRTMDAARAFGWPNALLATSYGLCQVLGGTAWDMGWKGTPDQLCVPATNIELCCKNLRSSLDRYHGTQRHRFALALIAYNGGQGRADAVARGLPNPAPASGVYSNEVMARWDGFAAGRMNS